MDRLGRCAADGCTAIFADTSRTARQRYRSHPCANRDAVRRHRARRSASSATRPAVRLMRRWLTRPPGCGGNGPVGRRTRA
ncbi:CGNR zinc finger domain-containing protein [Nonomuraea maheshkhaliensis]|uniref:CGNR zinc finger domain-containing protein n=1 Tax=Nonomuraea maheshkhaliensis TaxID=419590 RepID=UPI0031F969A9